MPQYIIYFNQQWVGEHTDEWFASRGPLANAVVEQIKDAGAYIFAAGVDEDVNAAFHADATSGEVAITQGLFAPTQQHIGGLTIIDVPNDETAHLWAGRIAEACGWPQEVRRVY